MQSSSQIVFLQAGCPSCRPINSVKALKGVEWNDCHLQNNLIAYQVDVKPCLFTHSEYCWCGTSYHH